MKRYSKLVRREPLGVTQRTNRAVMLAQISDPEQRARFEADFPENRMVPLPVPRSRRQRDDGSALDIDAIHRKQPPPLEKEVLRAVGDLLAMHPGVLYALRMNSGAASYEARSGKFAPIWFHIWVRSPEKCRMSDFLGATIDSRILALECKRPGWNKPTDERERQQAAFLATVRKIGGIGAFVTSADEALALLP